jgi:predicted transcriptional regulator
MDPQARIDDIAGQIERGEEPPTVTVRAFLSWFDAQRRGFSIVSRIQAILDQAHLRTEPDFQSAYIDSEIAFKSAAKHTELEQAAEAVADPEPVPTVRMIGGAVSEPTNRIGRLESANQKLVSVKPDAPLKEAITLMLINDFSQLPVMQSEHTLKGVVTWSSLGSKLALGIACRTVAECMDEANVTSSETSLFEAIGTIAQYQYVLIRNQQSKISGIVTTSDLSHQFRQLGEPFLLLGEIENHVRSLLIGKFNEQQVASVQDPDDPRKISSVADMTFGHYISVLEKPAHWELLKLGLDRSVVIRNLKRVRDIRNDVMHFDPDGLSNDDLGFLRDFSRFMQKLRSIGALDRTPAQELSLQE